MYKLILLIPFLLLVAAGNTFAQQSAKNSETGESIRTKLFKDGKPKFTPAAKSKPAEATLTSKDMVRQRIFTGSNGSGGRVTAKSAASGALKAKQSNNSGAALPSNTTATESAQKAKESQARNAAAIKPADLSAQGTEPAPPVIKPRTTTPKN